MCTGPRAPSSTWSTTWTAGQRRPSCSSASGGPSCSTGARSGATERAALERASVAGRAFWRGAVDDATPPEEREAVGTALIALVRRRLVLPERSELEGEDGFRFHHALIRDVAYSGIPPATRADLHESVARSLDGRHRALDELVGHHLEEAARLRNDPELAREA